LEPARGAQEIKGDGTRLKVIDLTSSETVKTKGFPAYLQVSTNEELKLSKDEVGIILGKHSHHEKGIGIFGGIVNPGWKGKLTIEFNIFGEIQIKKGEKIAHVLILTNQMKEEEIGL
jgi:deoxycytidine triphosphate deaminase